MIEIPSVLSLSTIVANAFGMTVEEMLAGKQQRKFVAAKAILADLLMKHLNLDTRQVANYFGYQSTGSVLDGIRKLDEYLFKKKISAANKVIQKEVRKLLASASQTPNLPLSPADACPPSTPSPVGKDPSPAPDTARSTHIPDPLHRKDDTFSDLGQAEDMTGTLPSAAPIPPPSHPQVDLLHAARLAEAAHAARSSAAAPHVVGPTPIHRGSQAPTVSESKPLPKVSETQLKLNTQPDILSMTIRDTYITSAITGLASTTIWLKQDICKLLGISVENYETATHWPQFVARMAVRITNAILKEESK